MKRKIFQSFLKAMKGVFPNAKCFCIYHLIITFAIDLGIIMITFVTTDFLTNHHILENQYFLFIPPNRSRM